MKKMMIASLAAAGVMFAVANQAHAGTNGSSSTSL